MPAVTSGNEGTQYVWALGYRGYQYDKETGLNYCQSRYYNPRIARWLNADEVAILEFLGNEVLGTNLYTYCNNNPITNADHTGNIVENLVGRCFAEQAAINAMKDDYAKQILSHWIYGKGKKLSIFYDAAWCVYLFKNKLLKDKIFDEVRGKISKDIVAQNKTSTTFSITGLNKKKEKTHNLYLTANHKGDYSTGYGLLNHVHFEASGIIKKISNNKYTVYVKYTISDRVDPNKSQGDNLPLFAIRGFVLNPWNGRDYDIEIKGDYNLVFKG